MTSEHVAKKIMNPHTVSTEKTASRTAVEKAEEKDNVCTSFLRQKSNVLLFP